MKTKSTTAISDILSRLMFEAKLKTTELARLIHLPQPTLHRIVTGASANPHLVSLEAIANYFNITVAQLKGLAPIGHLPMTSTYLGSDGIPLRALPILAWDNPSICDAQATMASQDNCKTVYTDAKVSNNAYAVQVHDTSMEPQFPVGTVLIIDRDKLPLIRDRSYVIIKTKAAGVLFRQVLIDGPHCYLKALNPQHESTKVQLFNANEDKVCGVLVQSKNNYDA